MLTITRIPITLSSNIWGIAFPKLRNIIYFADPRAFHQNVQSIITRIANGLVDYKLNDRLKFSMGLFVFSITDEESDFYAFREEHRIELKTKYQF